MTNGNEEYRSALAEFEALIEKDKKILDAVKSGDEDPNFSDEVNDAIRLRKEVEAMTADLERTKKESILKAGNFLAEHLMTLSRDRICRELKIDFKGVISPKFIQDCCPPEWKPTKKK